MQIKSTEIVAASFLQQLDSKTWEAVALKAINKMPKHKLQRESHRMFNDFVYMSSNSNSNNNQHLPEEIDDIRNIHETLLVGSTKIAGPPRRMIMTEAQESISQIPRQSAMKKIKNKRSDLQSLRSQQSQDEKKTESDKKPNDQGCLKLFVSELPIDKEAHQKREKIEDGMRTAQLQNMKYSTRVMQLQRQRQAASQQRTQAERKKYKQLKAFTYDYEGKLMSSAHKNTGNIKIISIRSHFNSFKTQKHAHHKLDSTKMSPIIQKKVIGNTEERVEQIRQSKIGRFLRAEVTRNMTELFREDKSVQMGVSITDMNSNSKLFGRDRDRSDKKNYNLQEFKNHSKITDGFKARTSMFVTKDKQERQENIVPASPHLRERIRTQIHSEAESKLFSSTFSRFGRNRGSISINNQKLYTETFHDVQR